MPASSVTIIEKASRTSVAVCSGSVSSGKTHGGVQLSELGTGTRGSLH